MMLWFRTKFGVILNAVAVLPAVLVVQGAPLKDLVETVPGYGRPPTTQFSGFLNATDGCDTSVNGNYCYLHYWLAMADTGGDEDNNMEEEKDVEDDVIMDGSSSSSSSPPVILWLNGGPGSSSILGWLTELGPLLMNATGGLMENPYSWTKAPAHVLALEAPVGVGYSYCEVQKIQNIPCQNTDRYTASASRAALVDFFTTKFPELSSSDFYITGESYAGVYIPTLAQEIITHNAKIDQQLLDLEQQQQEEDSDAAVIAAAKKVPLKGIAVGDPCTDNDAQADSMDDLWYGHKYGLVDDDVYDLLWNHCNVRAPNLLSRHGGIHMVIATLNHELQQIELQQEDDGHGNGGSGGGRRQRALELLQELIDYDNNQKTYKNVVTKDDDDDAINDDDSYDDDKCKLAYRKFLLSSSKGLSQSWRDLFIDDYSLFSPIDNLEDSFMAIFMMSDVVKKALHVEESPTTTWPYASQGFDYTKEYDACNWGDDIAIDKSMIDFYHDIVPQLDRTWVYNGDTDPCVSYEGTRTAVKRIGFDELDGGGYRPWFYNQTATTLKVLQEKAPLFGPNLLLQTMGSQYAGHVVNYEQGLAFVTIHGSGHMVPQFRPQAALHFLQMFLNSNGDKERDPNGGAALLAPLLSTNATLTGLSNDEFAELLDTWTELAKTGAYINAAEKSTKKNEERGNGGDTVTTVETALGDSKRTTTTTVIVGEVDQEEVVSTKLYLRG